MKNKCTVVFPEYYIFLLPLKVLSSEMDPAEILSSLKRQARKVFKKSARPPSSEIPSKY
jgi:hypothetical protein